MSKKSSIRWRESDRKELERAVKNYNAKIRYHEKKHPETAQHLPQKVKLKDVRESIDTRKELKETLQSFERFAERGAEKIVESKRGAKATQWEVGEFKRKVKKENARRAYERRQLNKEEVTSRGRKTGVKRSEMGTIKENAVKPIKTKFDNLSAKEWELAKGNIDRQLDAKFRESRKELMKENYIKGLINAGFPDELIEKIKRVPTDTFIKTVSTDTEASFDFIYDPIELKVKSDALSGVWDNALNG